MVYEDKKTKTLKLDAADKFVGLLIIGFPVITFFVALGYFVVR